MIPAIWGVVKAASWAQRGIAAGVLVGALGATFIAGYWKGVDSCEDEHAKEMLAQAVDVNKHQAKRDQALAVVDEKHDAYSRANEEKVKVVTHEIIKYVHDPKTKPCVLDPEYGRIVGLIERLQHQADSRVSVPDTTPREAHELQAKTVNTNQLLLGLDERNRELKRALEVIEFAQDFEQTRYKTEMEFYDKLHAEQMEAGKQYGVDP